MGGSSDLYRRPVWPSQDHRGNQRQSDGCERRTYPGWGAGAAQVEQTSLELHLPGVLPQSLPDGADFLLTVGQRRQGARVEGLPVAVASRRTISSTMTLLGSPWLQAFTLAPLIHINSHASNRALRWLRRLPLSQIWALITMATASRSETIAQTIGRFHLRQRAEV